MATLQTAASAPGSTLVLAKPMPAMTAATAIAAAPPPASSAASPSPKVAVRTLAATVPISQVRYINPNIAKQIVDMRPPVVGLPREQMTAPIAPSAEVAEDALFTDPKDALKHFYLPQYGLLEERTAGGEPRYAISVRQAGPEWTLTVRLRKSAPLSLGNAARGAAEIKHSIAILLRHTLIVSGAPAAVSEDAFSEVSVDGDLVTATMRLQTLAQRDAVVRALSEATAGSQLLVRRSVDVAIPVPPPVPPHPPVAGTPHPPVAVMRSDARIAMPAMRRMIMIDQGGFAFVKEPPSPPPPPPNLPPPVPLFRQVTRVLDTPVPPSPFTFPPSLHPYIYDGPSTGGSGHDLIRQGVPWRGVDHSYYQHPFDTWLFYYLPDSFKLVRRPNALHEPFMELRFLPAPAGTPGDPIVATRAVLDYIAYPVVNVERLADAAVKLKPLVALPMPAGVDGPQFQPLLVAADHLKLRIRLPDAAGFVERSQASVDLRSGIKDTIDLPLGDFQSVFDALFGAGLTLFTGVVAIDLGDGAGESVPFSARIEDMTGDVVDYTASPEGDSIRVKLTNAIESPISIVRLAATLQRGGQSSPATITGADLSKPVKLAPKETLEVILTPETSLPAGPETGVTLDLSGIDVDPNREAIFQEILDPTTPTAFGRTIHVVTAEERFKGGEPPLARIVVEFESGDAVDLHPGHVEGDADVRRPIADFVLRRGSTGAYKYRLQTLPASGGAPVVGEWIPGNSDIVLV